MNVETYEALPGERLDLARGLPPHQITHKFVEQYRASLSSTA